MEEKICIPLSEYERLKKLEKVDFELVAQFNESLRDVKQGKIKRVA